MDPRKHETTSRKPVALYTREISMDKNFIDVNYLNDISQGNTEFISAILQAFKQESHIFLIETQEQMAVKDYYALAKTAHRMKPAGAYIGAKNLTSLITSLEQAAKEINEPKINELIVQAKAMIKGILSEIEQHL